jgi:hypothetical protein
MQDRDNRRFNDVEDHQVNQLLTAEPALTFHIIMPGESDEATVAILPGMPEAVEIPMVSCGRTGFKWEILLRPKELQVNNKY